MFGIFIVLFAPVERQRVSETDDCREADRNCFYTYDFRFFSFCAIKGALSARLFAINLLRIQQVASD